MIFSALTADNVGDGNFFRRSGVNECYLPLIFCLED